MHIFEAVGAAAILLAGAGAALAAPPSTIGELDHQLAAIAVLTLAERHRLASIGWFAVRTWTM